MNQIQTNEKPLVIYHKNCLDGFGAAWCVWKFFKGNVEVHPGSYNKEPPDVEGKDVYIVDFSYKRPVIEEMLKKARTITIIDHHKSAIEDLELLNAHNFFKFFDATKSGAGLTWDYLFGDPRPPLINHIEDRDLWKFELPFTKEIQAALFVEDFDFEHWDGIIDGGKEQLALLATAGTTILKKHSKDVKALVDVCCRPMNIHGYTVPVASIPFMFASDAGHMMAEDNPFAACYYDTNTHREFSLRSSKKSGIDVSAIAVQYGGGGHFHAAGFKVPRDHELAKA